MVITILDFIQGKTTIIDCNYIEDNIDDVDDFIASLGYSLDNICYMTTNSNNIHMQTPKAIEDISV